MALYEERRRIVYVLRKLLDDEDFAYTYCLPDNIIASREAIQEWLESRAVGFRGITDLSAQIGDIYIPWSNLESAKVFKTSMEVWKWSKPNV